MLSFSGILYYSSAFLCGLGLLNFDGRRRRRSLYADVRHVGIIIIRYEINVTSLPLSRSRRMKHLRTLHCRYSGRAFVLEV